MTRQFIYKKRNVVVPVSEMYNYLFYIACILLLFDFVIAHCKPISP